MKDSAFLLLWLACAAALALAVWKMTQKEWVPATFLLLLGLGVIVTNVWVLRSLQQIDPAVAAGRGSAGPDGPIVMRWGAQESGQTLVWGFGYLVIAIVMALNAGTDWKRFLFYAGSIVLLGVTIFMLVLARDRRADRIVADAGGVEIQNRLENGASTATRPPAPAGEETEEDWELRHATKIAWHEVGAVKMVRVYRRKYQPRGAGSHWEFVRQELVFDGRDGKAMMHLQDPLEPPEAYRSFLEAIPRWTGLTIEEAERRG
ncbi:MAG: hypothetical protein U0167_14045 [bacterium]